MRVKATKPCFFGGRLQKEGDEFDVDDKKFSKSCMEKVKDAIKEDDAAAMAALFQEAEDLDIKTDKRWGEKRLRDEIAKAKADAEIDMARAVT